MCNFTTEFIYNDKPSVEPFLDQYGTSYIADLAYKTALRVWTRVKLAEAQNWKCCWCGCDTVEYPDKKKSATIEHIIPKALGGTDDWENLAMACKKCNNSRGTLDVEAFMINVAPKVAQNAEKANA